MAPILLASADPRRRRAPSADPAVQPPPKDRSSKSTPTPPLTLPASSASKSPSAKRSLAPTPTEPPPPAPLNVGWRPRDVRHVIRARASGSGLWVCDGRLVALATGRTLANIAGVEEVRVARPFSKHDAPPPSPPSGPSAEPLPLAGTDAAAAAAAAGTRAAGRRPDMSHSGALAVRDSLFYTVPGSGGLMRSFRLRPGSPARAVTHVLPAGGAVTVGRARQDGALVLARGAAAAATEADKDGTAPFTMVREPPRRIGSGLHAMLVASWAFVGRRVTLTAGGSGGGGGGTKLTMPAVVERCQYAVGEREGVWSWSRVARCPAWYGRGQCVTYLSARKVRGWDEVDERVRAWMGEAGRKRITEAGVLDAVMADGAGEAERGAKAVAEGSVEKAKEGESAGVVVASGTGSGTGGGRGGEGGRRRRKLFGII